MPITISGTTGIALDGQFNSASTFGFKNRIINGAMVIDQRNAGASVSNGTGSTVNYPVDRWTAYGSQATKFTGQRNAGSATPPSGFTNYIGFTSSSAYSVLSSDYFVSYHRIEGFNVADLDWGTASAQTITLSFWAQSSLTGTFGGSLSNNAFNRSYPFTFAINAANTWEQKTITIAGDTSGTWAKDNTTGISLSFSLGSGSTYSGTAGAWTGSGLFSATGATSVVGTNGATFYITGVQLEKGSTATSFDVRPFSTELLMCQRYYESTFPIGTAPVQNGGTGNALRISQVAVAGNACRGNTWLFKTTKRDTPATITSYNSSAANANVRNTSRSNDATISGVGALNTMGIAFTFVSSTGSAVGDDNAVGFSVDAEL
jgi:hypothetical protein